MRDKFNPAPHDKHATTPSQKAADADRHRNLDEALADSFPASDPASDVQPSPAKPHRSEKPQRGRRN